MRRGRLEGAVDAVRESIAVAAGIPAASIGADDDLYEDLHLDQCEAESLRLVLEEIFGVRVPDCLWNTPLHRTATATAEWLVRAAETAAWQEAKRKCA
jgi:hypothetical protein